MTDADTGGEPADGAVPTKAALRRTIRAARRAAPTDEGRADRVAAAVLANPEVARRLAGPGASVATYVSLPWEPPTGVLRQRLRALGVRVVLPVADPNGGLTWVVDDGTAGAAWGVPGQPPSPPAPATAAQSGEATAVVVVPALAATSDGRRLGQGGGYYDRFLADLPAAATGGPLLAAVVGPDELLDDLPTEPHDRRVDVVIIA